MIIADAARRVPTFITYGNNILTGTALTIFNVILSTVSPPGVAINPVSGAANVIRVSTSAGTTGHYIRLSSPEVLISGNVYTYAWDVKADTAQFVQLMFQPAISNDYANFDLINGLATASSSGASPSIIDLGFGWRRIAVTFTAATGAAILNNVFLMFIGSGIDARFTSMVVTAGQEKSILACNPQFVTGNVANAV